MSKLSSNEEGQIGSEMIHNNKFSLSKTDLELFDEEKRAMVAPVYRVKRVSLKGEKWKIFKDSEVMLIVDALRLSKGEKTFLRSLEGVNFLIASCKDGAKSVSELKRRLKTLLSENE